MGAIMKGAKKRKTLTISVPKKKGRTKAQLIERIRQLPESIGGKDIKRFGMGPTKPKKHEVIIKKKLKPSKTKLADTWQDRRIQAINKKIKKSGGKPYIAEGYAQEASDIYKSKAKTKKLYKSIQRKWHGLTPDQKDKVYAKRSHRDPKSFHFDKKKFGKK